MGNYQGRALQRDPRGARRGERGGEGAGLAAVILRRALLIAGVAAFAAAMALVPWRSLRQRYAILTDVRVEGFRYLDAERIRKDAALTVGQDLLGIDLSRVRQRVMLDPRVATADVGRSSLRGIRIRVTERVPQLLISHGETWEVDSAGVLLAPLQTGSVADAPMLSGVDVSFYRAGTQVRTAPVQRGLAWMAVLSDNALRLAGQVSEVDVSEPRRTRIVLLNGTVVVGPAFPASMRQLTGLRATLADLAEKGMKPGEVDVRFPEQIIVRAATPVAIAAGPQSPS